MKALKDECGPKDSTNNNMGQSGTPCVEGKEVIVDAAKGLDLQGNVTDFGPIQQLVNVVGVALESEEVPAKSDPRHLTMKMPSLRSEDRLRTAGQGIPLGIVEWRKDQS